MLDELKSMQGSREGENQQRTPQRIAEIIKNRCRTFASVRVENPECSALSLAGSLRDGKSALRRRSSIGIEEIDTVGADAEVALEIPSDGWTQRIVQVT
jgi:hypothetical protein